MAQFVALIAGALGAFLGDWFLPRSLAVSATFGAMILVLVLGLVAGDSRSSGRWEANRFGGKSAASGSGGALE
jgi:hypothetical protein